MLRQGDQGEYFAIAWLGSIGADVYVPLGHSPDVDVVARLDGRLVGVQVKTSRGIERGRWRIALATRGGNQSWNGLVKRFSSSRCDYLYVHTARGRRWFIPSSEVEGTTAIFLGGSKYADYEVSPGPALTLS